MAIAATGDPTLDVISSVNWSVGPSGPLGVAIGSAPAAPSQLHSASSAACGAAGMALTSSSALVSSMSQSGNPDATTAPTALLGSYPATPHPADCVASSPRPAALTGGITVGVTGATIWGEQQSVGAVSGSASSGFETLASATSAQSCGTAALVGVSDPRVAEMVAALAAAWQLIPSGAVGVGSPTPRQTPAVDWRP